jgi:tetratricopeptide (TPR) repeat protein
MTRACKALVLALALAVPVAVLPPVPTAQADDDPDLTEARKHFKRGEKLFALGRFAEALDAYEAAFEAKALPDFLFNVAQCHRNLGNYDQAIFSYRKYLKLKPEAHNRAAVEKLIDDLVEKREQERNKKRDRKLVPTPKPVDKDDGGVSPWWYVGGSVAVVAVTVGAVVLLSGDDGTSIPDSDLGNLDFGK